MTIPQLRAQIVSTTTAHLSSLDRVVINGTRCTHVATNRNEHILFSERGGIEVRVSHEEFGRLLDQNDASIDYDWYAPTEINLRSALRGKTLDDYDREDVAYSRYKEKMVNRWLVRAAEAGERIFLNDDLTPQLALWSVDLQKKQKGDRADTTTLYHPPSLTTFRTWLKRYVECGYRLEALLPRHRGPGKYPINDDADSYRVWKHFARGYISNRKPTVAHQYRELLGHIEKVNPGRLLGGLPELVPPSLKKFRKMIANLNQFEVKAGREGLEAASRYFQKILRNYDVTRPGQRVEMDSHLVDLKTFLVETELWFQFDDAAKAEIEISNIRIWFVSAVDAATRYCLALHGGFTQNSDTAAAALRMILTDKTHISDLVGAKTPWNGKLLPEELDTDNGSEFLEGEFRQMCLSLGIEHTTPAAAEPARRPFIESFIGTFSEKLCVHFDGRTFSSVAERKGANAEDRTVLTVEELIKAAYLVVCDDYHNAPHEGLGGNSPHNEFHSLARQWPPHYPPSRKRQREVFGLRFKRKIHPYGIVVWGVTYNSDGLQSQRQKHGQMHYEVRVDPNSIRMISVRIEGEWIDVENEIGIDDSISLAEWVYTLRQETSENKSAVMSGLKVIYATINRLREAGIAAQLRAGIEPDVLDPIVFERLEDKVLGGARFERPKAPLIIIADNPNDPLRGLQIGSRTPVAAAPKLPTAEQAATHDQETAVSQFDEREEL